MDLGDSGFPDWLGSVRGRNEVARSSVTKAPPVFAESGERSSGGASNERHCRLKLSALIND